MNRELYILEVCEKEISHLPDDIKADFINAVDQLKRGLTLSMPISRALYKVKVGLFELRLKSKQGVFRIFYYKRKASIYVVHAMQKKTTKIPSKTIRLVKKRIRSLQ